MNIEIYMLIIFYLLKYMLIWGDVRISVVQLIAEWKRDGGNERWAFKTKT